MAGACLPWSPCAVPHSPSVRTGWTFCALKKLVDVVSACGKEKEKEFLSSQTYRTAGKSVTHNGYADIWILNGYRWLSAKTNIEIGMQQHY